MTSAPQLTHKTLIDELESAVAGGEISRRANVLQRVTDLFVVNSGQLTDEQMALFDDVMICLINEIDDEARTAFGQRVAGLERSPPGLIRELARDDLIDVAGPILTLAEQIDTEFLVETAMTKSQDHLLAISKRRQLPESVTDILVERGNQQVAASTIENPGARFSEFGYATLVGRAEADRVLAACIWQRPDIPHRHLLVLFAAASDAVQREFQSMNPGKADEIKVLVRRARDELQSRSREASPAFLAARARVESLFKSEKLSEASVWTFARSGKFDETSVALALMCDVPIFIVERALNHDEYDQLLVLARSIDFSFDTVKAILSMRVRTTDELSSDLKEASMSFARLRPETAAKTLQYYRLRARTVLN